VMYGPGEPPRVPIAFQDGGVWAGLSLYSATE
jgi:hypothetical protein